MLSFRRAIDQSEHYVIRQYPCEKWITTTNDQVNDRVNDQVNDRVDDRVNDRVDDRVDDEVGDQMATWTSK